MKRRLLLLCLLGCPVFLAAEDRYVEGEVLVTFKQDVALNGAKRSLGGRALELTEHFDRLSEKQGKVSGMIRNKARTTAALIEELKNDPSVEMVEPNYLRKVYFRTPDDTHFTRLWGLKNTGQSVNGTGGTSGVDTKFMEAWNLSRPTSSSPPVVAVIDTGVDITHPDLAANIWTNPGEIPGNGIDDDGNGYVDDVHGYDFALGTAAMTDASDHGTHVAGTIAAVGKNNFGVIGLQFNAKVIPMKVSSDGEYMSLSATIAAYNYTVALKQRGVNIVAVNASFGAGTYSNTERNAIIALRNAGIVFCAAAGNDTSDNDGTVDYPSSYDISNIIAVASHTSTGALSWFSNYGETTVDIAAPGSDIYSTMPVSMARNTSVQVGSTTYASQVLEYSGVTASTGIIRTIHYCGLGGSGDFPAAVNGNIALIQRGTHEFSKKVTHAKDAGAVAVIIFDNTTEPLNQPGWTLGSQTNWLPSVRVTQATGNAILASLPASGTVINWADPSLAYQFIDGTSMACPHVAGAVAFAAWNFPSETMAQRINRILSRALPVPAFAGKMTTGGRLDLLRIIDTDDDGLPDWWEQEQFGTLAHSAGDDPDGDGFNNLTEFLAGTSPTSGASRLAFSSTAMSGSDFVLTFSTINERTYEIEWSENLEADSWQLLGSTRIGNGSPLQVNDPVSGVPRRFYRLKLIE